MSIEQLGLPILGSGIIVLGHHPYHKKLLLRYEAQLLYLKSMEIGVFIYAFASLLALAPPLLNRLIPPFLMFNLNALGGVGWSGGLLLAAWGWCRVANGLLRLLDRKWKQHCSSDLVNLALLKACIAKGSLEERLFQAMLTQDPLLFRLKSGATYWGLVEELSGLAQPDASKQLLTIRLLGPIDASTPQMPQGPQAVEERLTGWLAQYPGLITFAKNEVFQVTHFKHL